MRTLPLSPSCALAQTFIPQTAGFWGDLTEASACLIIRRPTMSLSCVCCHPLLFHPQYPKQDQKHQDKITDGRWLRVRRNCPRVQSRTSNITEETHSLACLWRWNYHVYYQPTKKVLPPVTVSFSLGPHISVPSLAETARSHPYLNPLLLHGHSVRSWFPASFLFRCDHKNGYEWKCPEVLPGPSSNLVSFLCPLAKVREQRTRMKSESHSSWGDCLEKQLTHQPLQIQWTDMGKKYSFTISSHLYWRVIRMLDWL